MFHIDRWNVTYFTNFYRYSSLQYKHREKANRAKLSYKSFKQKRRDQNEQEKASHDREWNGRGKDN